MSVTTIPPGVPKAPQGAIPAIGIPDSQDIPRLVYCAPYFTTVPLAELIEPAVLEATEGLLPSLVPPYVADAANAAVAQQAVMLTGSTMTGPLFLNGLPTQPSQAATMSYVDLMVSTAGVPEVPPVPTGQTWARQTGQWVPVDPSGGNFLPVTGGTMQGQINMSGNAITNLPTLPVMPNGAAPAQWVLQQIAAQSLYQGTWTPDTNVPDLTNPGVHQNGYTFIVTTTTTGGVVVSQPIPGLQGLTVFNGDTVIYSNIAGGFQVIHGGGLSLDEANALFLALAGGQMSGQLMLNAEATNAMQAVPLQQVQSLLATAGIPEAPNDGQIYGRIGLTSTWLPVLGINGGTLNGALLLNANAVQQLGAVPLQQLNSTLGNYVPLGGNATIIGPLTMSGAGASLTLNSNASANLQAVPLQQLNAVVNAVASKDVGRNLLHNSMFNVAQRGAGVWAAAGYTVDRWAFSMNNDLIGVGTVTLGDAARANIGDEAAKFALGNTFTGSPVVSSYNAGYQHVEDARRLAGKTVAVSFWAQGSLAGMRLGVSFIQHMGSGGSPSADVELNGQPIVLGTGWTRYSLTFTIPSLSGKTLGTNNDHSTMLYLIYSAEASRNTWSGGVGVQSGTINIWGVQLEIGTQATPLEKPDPRYDLANCQRFYSQGGGTWSGYGDAASNAYVINSLPQQMRAVPTLTLTPSSATNLNALTSGGATLSMFVQIANATDNAAAINWNFSYTASADL